MTVKTVIYLLVFIKLIIILGCSTPTQIIEKQDATASAEVNNFPIKPQIDLVLGPQSVQAIGEQRVLIIAASFPGTNPTFTLQQTEQRVLESLKYIEDQSYGKAWIKADFKAGTLIDPLDEYKVSRYNKAVDRSRVKKLVEDAMTAVQDQTDFSTYHHIIVIPRAKTRGYGMICYNANPGMMGTTMWGRYHHRRYITVTAGNGEKFSGGISMGLEIAHPGMYPYDFMYHLGGLHQQRRLVPCQYDFKRQSDPNTPRGPENIAIYVGPWDIMSQMFVERFKPPQGTTSFTRIRLGWISADQVIPVLPGETRTVTLHPLSLGGEILAVKVPIKKGRYYLIENRQRLGYDEVLPDTGILVLRIDPKTPEGSGPVRVMDADPAAPHFSRATYRLGKVGRDRFIDVENGVVVEVIGEAGNNVTVRISNTP